VNIGGNTRLAGVIGWPVGHSRSPRIHNFWLRRHHIDGAYMPLAVAPERLADAVRGLLALGFAGANVTVPHKQAVIRALDSVDERARRMGAVNTIVVGADGGLSGSNSDGCGFLENLRAGSGWRADAGAAVVIGAGGAARAVSVALQDAGVAEIRIVNRTGERAQELVRALGPPLLAVPWDERNDALQDAALLVNATSLGMTGHPALAIVLDGLAQNAVVNDIVYTPLETPLLAAAAAHGYPVVDGLGMLLHQARPGFAAWFGRRPEVDQALRDHIVADLGG
jgi:shikimate dehydrogenase